MARPWRRSSARSGVFRWYARIGCWASSRSPVVIPRHLDANKNEQPQADCTMKQTASPISGRSALLTTRTFAISRIPALIAWSGGRALERSRRSDIGNLDDGRVSAVAFHQSIRGKVRDDRLSLPFDLSTDAEGPGATP